MSETLTTTYQEIAEYLQASVGQCALILGPELSVDQKGVGYKSYFRKIAADKNNGVFIYFEEDNLFAFNDDRGLKNTRRLVKEFYNHSGDKGLLETIARIRFPLIINLCPDLALNKVYEDLGIPFKSAYFTRDNTPQFKELPEPTKELPVIYNIFGTVDPDTTLILNHSKLYETIQYLLPDNSLPESIETFLNRASSFILLGLKFDSWYYQLICHKLKLKEYNKSKTNLSASSTNFDDSVSVVMRKHFEIDFTADNPMQAMSRLVAECNGSELALRNFEGLGSHSLFVSYAWKDKDDNTVPNRETVVDWLEKKSALSEMNTLLFFRDHNDLQFGDSIDSFMTRIGKGKIVIRVISDKYLKSRYCMTEALRMSNYRDDEKRIISIIWEDADLENEIIYRDFWKEKCQLILEDIEKKLDNNNYDHAVHIYRFITAFINGLKNEVHLRISKSDFSMDPATGEIQIADARKADFEQLINTVTNKINAS
ncbi:MAG: toll/interleukin-1 receptor domain-containing protein [Ferruginibacter sp.]